MCIRDSSRRKSREKQLRPRKLPDRAVRSVLQSFIKKFQMCIRDRLQAAISFCTGQFIICNLSIIFFIKKFPSDNMVKFLPYYLRELFYAISALRIFPSSRLANTIASTNAAASAIGPASVSYTHLFHGRGAPHGRIRNRYLL